MNMPVMLDTRGKRALTIAVLIAFGIGVLLLAPYFAVIVTSAIAAFIFYPVYDWFRRRLKRPGVSAALTTLSAVLIVILPVLVLVFTTFREVQGAAASLSHYAERTDLNAALEGALRSVNDLLASVTGGNMQVSVSQAQELAGSAISRVSQILLNFLANSVGSIGAVVASVVLFVYIFSSLLMHHKPLIKTFKGLNPLGDDTSNLYLQKAGDMTKAMVRGQFVIAVMQGTLSAIFLYIAGVQLFWLMAMILTLLSIIPLGAGIVTIPIGVIMLLGGNIWQGMTVLLGHFLVVTNIDNILRPMLVPKSARLNSALTLLSVFAGIKMFGLLGIVVGPVIMILIVTTFKVYLEQTQAESHKSPVHEQSPSA